MKNISIQNKYIRNSKSKYPIRNSTRRYLRNLTQTTPQQDTTRVFLQQKPTHRYPLRSLTRSSQ